MSERFADLTDWVNWMVCAYAAKWEQLKTTRMILGRAWLEIIYLLQ